MSRAMEAVFGTVELLEDILVTALLQGMTHKQLLYAQRVSRSWKATIDDSPLLQKALYFRPATTTEDFEFFRQWTRNDIAEGRWVSYSTRDYQSTDQGDDSIEFGVFINPSIDATIDKDLPDIPRASASGARHGADLCRDEVFDIWKIHKDVGKYKVLQGGPKREMFERWNQPRASWVRMVLSQPPPIAVTMHYLDKSLKVQNKTVRNSAGLNLLDLFSAAMVVDEPYDAKSKVKFEKDWIFDERMAVELRDFWKASGDHFNELDLEGISDDDDDDDDYDFSEDAIRQREERLEWAAGAELYGPVVDFGSLDEYDSDEV